MTCSFEASPDPSATVRRPGNISPSVAMAWAMITGWYRWPGAFTTPNGTVVACMAAPSHDQANPDSPWSRLHGVRWSEDDTAPKPAASARAASASSADGRCCSCEAW